MIKTEERILKNSKNKDSKTFRVNSISYDSDNMLVIIEHQIPYCYKNKFINDFGLVEPPSNNLLKRWLDDINR